MQTRIFDYNTIEKYIDGLLDEENTKAIEDRIKSDKEFSKEIAIWRSIIHSIPNEDAELKVKHFHNSLKKQGFLDTIHQELSNKKTKPILWKSPRFIIVGITSLAASLIGLIFVWNLNQSTDLNTLPFADLLSPEIEFSVRAEHTTITKMEKQALQILKQGMVAYNKQDYVPAITHYTHFLQKIEQNCCRPITNQYYNIRVELYLGDALLKTGQAKEALPHFETISNSKILNQEEEIKYLEAAKWYTALAYLELSQVQEAVYILQELQSSTFYKQKSQQLLLELK